jgi:hypothetical protein
MRKAEEYKAEDCGADKAIISSFGATNCDETGMTDNCGTDINVDQTEESCGKMKMADICGAEYCAADDSGAANCGARNCVKGKTCRNCGEQRCVGRCDTMKTVDNVGAKNCAAEYCGAESCVYDKTCRNS